MSSPSKRTIIDSPVQSPCSCSAATFPNLTCKPSPSLFYQIPGGLSGEFIAVANSYLVGYMFSLSNIDFYMLCMINRAFFSYLDSYGTFET